jgi:hypothetical protein
VQASGNSNSVKNYSFIHQSPSDGLNYYRIIEQDQDGRKNYSEIRSIKFTSIIAPFVILENPVKDGRLQLKVKYTTEISLLESDGKLVWKAKLDAGVNYIEMDKLSRGLYVLKTGDFVKRILL